MGWAEAAKAIVIKGPYLLPHYLTSHGPKVSNVAAAKAVLEKLVECGVLNLEDNKYYKYIPRQECVSWETIPESPIRHAFQKMNVNFDAYKATLSETFTATRRRRQ